MGTYYMKTIQGEKSLPHQQPVSFGFGDLGFRIEVESAGFAWR